LVVPCCLSEEARVCQCAQDQNAIMPPLGSYVDGEESILGCYAPGLLHLHGWRTGKSSEGRLAIFDVKISQSGTINFQCISTATVPIPERR